MSEGYSSACARALNCFSTQRDPSLVVLLRRIAWELLYVAPEGTADLGIIIRDREGRLLVGNAREYSALPLDTLKGLVLEHEPRSTAVLVRDHALDGARFVDAAPRSSIICRANVPAEISSRRECFLWLGLYAVAHARLVEQARMMVEQLGEWLRKYEGVIASIISNAARLSDVEERERELVAVLHDVRAPVGGIKYLLTEMSVADEIAGGVVSNVSRELAYLESLLVSLGPTQVEGSRFSLGLCDVYGVVQRVVARCRREGERDGVVLTIQGGINGVTARIPDIELERVLSNLIANACRHSKCGAVSICVRVDKARVVVIINDTGPGIDPRVIAELSDPHRRSVSGSVGWGVGLLSSKRRIERYAGELSVVSSSAAGTSIELIVPRGPDTIEAKSQVSISDSDAIPIDLLIVDDDPQQVLSLQRLLTTNGLIVRGVTSIVEALELLVSRGVSAVLCDATMPDGGALELIATLSERGISSRIAVASGDGTEELLYRCAAHGAREFFCKPVEIQALLSWLHSDQSE